MALRVITCYFAMVLRVITCYMYINYLYNITKCCLQASVFCSAKSYCNTDAYMYMSCSHSEGAELLSRYTVIEDSPLGASSSGRNSRGFSLGTRPRTQNTSGFAMPEKSADFYQQQLLQTQQLYFQQQTAISQLTATINKLQKSIESSDKRSQVHNIRCTPPTRSSTVTLADLSASDVSDGSLSSDRDGSKSEDEVSVSSRRPRLDLEIRDCDGDRSKSKLDRIKDLEDKLGKDKLFALDVHELVSTTVNQRLESCIDHKSAAVEDLLKKYVSLK